MQDDPVKHQHRAADNQQDEKNRAADLKLEYKGEKTHQDPHGQQKLEHAKNLLSQGMAHQP